MNDSNQAGLSQINAFCPINALPRTYDVKFVLDAPPPKKKKAKLNHSIYVVSWLIQRGLRITSRSMSSPK